MSSFFGKLRSPSTPSTPLVGSSKKGAAAVPLTPFEQLIADSGPIRKDGSDKFFGMHNPSNTCYCNSILQCLYFSEPFREHVISYPHRSNGPRTMASSSPQNHTSPNVPNTIDEVTANTPVSKPQPADSLNPASPKKPNTSPNSPSLSSPKQEENKESFDYLKKQALAAGPILSMTQGYADSYGMPESLFTGLKDMFEAVVSQQSRVGIITPAKFLEILRRNYELFRSPMHQDAHEFLNLLLNEVVEQVEKFSKELSDNPKQTDAGGGLGISSLPLPHPSIDPSAGKRTNTSWVHDLFEGTLTSETRCLTCETTSQRDEVFLDLSVDLEEHSSVTSCLRKFSEEEMLCERNKFHCDRCGGLQEAEKRMKIKRLPKILALHLKRFKYIEDLGRLQKLFHRVVFPFHLRMMNTTDDAEDPDRLYELYAVVVHLGSTPFHGHYVSIIKTKDKGWLLFDDELVLPVDKNYVRNYFGDPKSPACAYVLFYQETTIEAVQQEQDMEESTTGRATEPEVSETTTNTETNGTLYPDMVVPKAKSLDAVAQLDRAITASQPPNHTHLKPTPLSHVKSNPNPLDHAEVDPSRHSVSVDPHVDAPEEEELAYEKLPQKDLSAAKGGLSRFRPPSLSLRQKPKWMSKDRADPLKDALDGGVAENTLSEEPHAPLVDDSPDKQHKQRGMSRFSLGKKKPAQLS